MPRPKRIGPAKTATKPTAPPAPTLSAVPPHISSPKSKASNTNSDDSDGLVKTRPGAIKNRNPIYRMSGAAPIEDVIQDGKRLKPIRGQKRAALNRIAREDEATTKALDEMKQRMQAEKERKKGTQQKTIATTIEPVAPAPPATLQVERSQPEMDVEESIARPVPGSAWKRASAAPMSVRKPMSTPRAEASMLALANFRRRPRAPSILGIGDDNDETASISSGGSFGDLEVDDESTPLPKMRTQTMSRPAQAVSPPSFGDAEPQTSSSRKRKRGSAEFRVPDSQPQVQQDLDRAPQSSPTRPIEIPSDGSSRSSSPLSDVSLPEFRPETPKDSSHTPSSAMAPPMSSSPVQAGAEEPAEQLSSPLTKRGSKQSASGPGVAKTWNRNRKAKASKPVDTAVLQSLLPKRRQKKASSGDFDIYESDDGLGAGSDADELSFAPSKRQATKRSRQALSEKKASSTNARKQTRGAKANGKDAASTTKRGRRSYSRREAQQENEVTISDAEDTRVSDVEVDDSIEAGARAKSNVTLKPSKALQALAQKFAEVDNWEMDFEDATGSSDIMKNAR